MLLEIGANRCLSEARIVRPRGLEPLTNRVPNTSSHAVQACVAEVILRGSRAERSSAVPTCQSKVHIKL